MVSGSWDRSLRIYDLRTSKPVGVIGGPLVSGNDAIDISGDQILVSSYRSKE